MIKMIALDLDGTLALENHQVSPATRDALRALHEGDDVEVVIATGRRYRTTRFVIENLGFDVFAVCNGGALVKTPEQTTLHKETLDVTEIAGVAREVGLALFAQRDVHELGGADFVIDAVPAWNGMTKQHFETNRAWSAAEDLANYPDEFLVSGAFGSEEAVRKLADALASNFPGAFNTIVVPHLDTGYHYCEVALQHVDKWHGLQQLNKHLNIDPAHICTVGDQLNDMAMVSAAGHGVAMANGHEELQDIAVFVCGHNQEDGIVDVVNYIHDINEKSRAS